ncbi:MAG TPA: hypothetical protein VIJ66_05275 [Solirubrobacteraceae bacterium]
MSKKLYAAFAPLLVVAAFAIVPTVAQAQPHWYSNGTKIGATKVAVTTHGHLKLEDKELEGGTKFTEGEVKDCGYIWNPVGGGAGLDEITCFETSKNVSNICPEGAVTEVVPTKLPWLTELIAGPPILDRITGIEIDIRCSGTVVATYEGTLEPKFVNSNPSFAEFNGSGFLTNTATGTKGAISGNDFIEGPSGDNPITVKNP